MNIKTYNSIEEIDNDCVVVFQPESMDTPERFWKYEVIRKKDVERVKKYFIKSNYKPSTIPYFTNKQMINAMNENIKRGHYCPTQDTEIVHDDLIITD